MAGKLSPVRVHELTKFQCQWVFQTIEHLLPLLFPIQDTRRCEQGKMLGNVGLCRSHRGDNVVNHQWFPANRLKNLQSHRFRQQLEMRSHNFELIVGQNTVSFRGGHI
jgi:hypothetical protein